MGKLLINIQFISGRFPEGLISIFGKVDYHREIIGGTIWKVVLYTYLKSGLGIA